MQMMVKLILCFLVAQVSDNQFKKCKEGGEIVVEPNLYHQQMKIEKNGKSHEIPIITIAKKKLEMLLLNLF